MNINDLKTFDDALDDSCIQDKKKKILGDAARTPKVPIEVMQVAKYFADKNIQHTVPLTNDISVWNAMRVLKNGQQLKDVLRACLRDAGIEFDYKELGKLLLPECIVFFFSIFDLTPKSPRQPKTDETQQERGSPAGDSNERSNTSPTSIMPHYSGPIKIQAESVAKAFRVERIESEQDVRRALHGMPTRTRYDVLRECLELTGQNFEEDRLRDIPLMSIESFFLDIFNIVYSPKKRANTTVISNEQKAWPQMSFEAVQNIYDHGEWTEGGIDPVDGDFVPFYRNMPITLKDHLSLHLDSSVQLYEGFAALFNAQNGNVAAFGHIELCRESDTDLEGELIPHIVFPSSQIRFDEFEHQDIFNLALIPKFEEIFFTSSPEQTITPERGADYRGKLYIVRDLDYRMKKLLDSEKVLCIDFGTSNTTAGSYGFKSNNETDISLVLFQDVTAETPIMRDMLPTMVYVTSCGQGREPEYSFGYEAKKKLIENDYIPKATIFFEIKRWINSLDKAEEITDDKGSKETVYRRDILLAYLRYVVSMAEQQFKVHFKKLHFTAPVKLKEVFLNKLKKMFENEREVMDSKESLDEGVAIVYDWISNSIRESTSENETNDILILDCGGGTTDLVRSRCTRTQDEFGNNELFIATNFENGESNFGGDNITYRILQMIKIKIAEKIRTNKDITMMDLIPQEEDIILSHIDKSNAKNEQPLDDKESLQPGKAGIYEKFESSYRKAEEIIPTRFAECKQKNEKKLMRRNFHYLWKMAEAIKIEFFKSNLAQVEFSRNSRDDVRIYVGDQEQYYLSVFKKGNRLVSEEQPLKDIQITFKEINRIICPDIYALLNVLLSDIFNSSVKEAPKFYRLSGQSCKITLFRDLMKEFIPGKSIRSGQGGRGRKGEGEDSATLKKFCIRGSIAYIRDRELGIVSPHIGTPTVRQIYDVYFMDGSGEKLILGRDESIFPIIRPKEMREAHFRVKDVNGIIKNKIDYQLDVRGDQKSNSLECINDKLANISFEKYKNKIIEELRDIPDKMKNGERKVVLFAVPSNEGYGVYILQVLVECEEDSHVYWLPKDTAFYGYENEDLQNFFDGLR